MKKTKIIFMSVLLAVCALALGFAFAGCHKDKDGGNYGYGEEGYYYYEGAGDKTYILSLQGGRYMLTFGEDETYSGSYSCDGETGEITFTGDETFTALLGENALTLTMGDTGHAFKAYVYFDVTYLDADGNVLYAEKVLNGKSAEDLPYEKEGYHFIGWYLAPDGGGEFSFDTSIASDTVLYAWLIEKNPLATDFEVTFDYGAGDRETVTTQNGAVWKLPASREGRDILGWWVSATNREGELTYRYAEGDVLFEDTTLFAVYDGAGVIGASVTKDGITWENVLSANVTIAVYDDGGAVAVSSTVVGGNKKYTSSAFESLSAGTYRVEVTAGGVTETLVYVVNRLARVSISSMTVTVGESSSVLSFSGVDGAEGYEITVSDGEITRSFDLGSDTFYNFTAWEMTGAGLTFTVRAYAEGYVDSVSEAFNYYLALERPRIDVQGDTVTWTAVENATSYEVTVQSGYETDTYTVTETSFSLKYYGAGAYDVTVTAKAYGYLSASNTYYGYGKSTIASPKITGINTYSVSWTLVAGAAGYVVDISGATYEVNGETLLFTDVPEGQGVYEIRVMAVGDGGNDSPYCDPVFATEGTLSSAVTYEKNTVSWVYDIAAEYYEVDVNGVKTYTACEGNSVAVELTKEGENILTVTAYAADGTPRGEAKTSVTAYSVTLDPSGAALDSDAPAGGVAYVAKGDTLSLGGVTKEHAYFVGWYTLADFTEGQSDYYSGDGYEVKDGSTFTSTSSLYLYAYWRYEDIEVTLYDGSAECGSVVIRYNSTSYELPVLSAEREEEDFSGWYSESSGGTRYGMPDGSPAGSGYAGGEELFARFTETRAYTKTRYNGEEVYSVSATSDAREVTEMTVPAGYVAGGKTYGIVFTSDAFSDCSYLEILNIPDTVLYIALSNDGYSSGSGAFAGVNSLKEVNVYATGDEPDSTKEVTYYSCDGVLFRRLSLSEGVELLYYPYGRELCAYEVPSVVYNEYECDEWGNALVREVVSIPSQVFKGRKVSEVTIPATVTEVASQAFYSNTVLERVCFEEGGTESLYIGDRAFSQCPSLVEVDLPSRYSDFNIQAFSDCAALQNVDFEPGGVYTSDGGVVLKDGGATLVYLPSGRSGEIDTGTLTSGSIVKIGEGAFASNANVTKLTVSSSVSEIGAGALEGCTHLEEIVFEGAEDSARLTIRSRAFYGCTALSEVYLPVNLTVLEENAFGGCTNLFYVYFDSFTGATSSDLDFAANAFGADSYVYTLEFGANVPEIDFGEIFGSARLEKIIIDVESKAYFAGDDSVVYNAEKTTIMFYPVNKTGEYELLSTTTNIKEGVFTNRVNLTKITIGENVNTIPEGTFDGCSYLTAIEVKTGNENYMSDGGILYTKDADGNAETLVCCPVRNSVTTITAPSTVTYVEEGAFANNVTVTSVTFTSTGSFSMGSRAFYGATALASVTLPEAVTEIPDYAFYNCTKLKSVNIPSGVSRIGNYAFYYCALMGDLSSHGSSAYVTLPESLTYIGNYAFYHCDDLAVTIPVSVYHIGNYAFSYCWNSSTATAAISFASVGEEGAPDLTIGSYAFQRTQYANGITIPANVVSLGTYAFNYSTWLATAGEIAFEEGSKLTEISDYAFACMKVSKVSIPESVVTIGSHAFYSTSSTISELSFAEEGNLETIGTYAFQNAAITGVEIPASVETIESYAFSGVKFADGENGADGVTFAEGSKIKEIGSSAFGSSVMTHMTLPEGLTTLNQIFGASTTMESVTMPSTLVEIGKSAFSFCTAIKSMEIPARIESIGSSAFYGCTNLSSVTFAEGSNLSYVGDKAFSYCPSLTELSFPESTSDITLGNSIIATESGDSPEGAYYYPTPVTRVYLSSSVTEVEGAFGGALYLETIELAENHPTLEVTADGGVLYSKAKDTIIFVVSSIEEADFSGTSITKIASHAFDDKTTLKKVTLSANITYVGDYAFDGCTSLETVVVAGASGTAFGEGVFYGCSSLKSFSFPEGMTRVPDYFFYGCGSLTECLLSETIYEIGEYAFYGAGSASSEGLVLDASKVTSFEGDCFMDSGLVGIKLGTDGTKITFTANDFNGCERLEEIALPEGITQIPQAFMEGCTSITYIVIPSTVTEIKLDAFQGSTSLADVTMHDGITAIGARVFEYCESLNAVTMPEGVTTLSQQLFSGSGLVSVTLPAGLTSSGLKVFDGCERLEYVDFNHCYLEINDSMFYNVSTLTTIENYENLVAIGASAFNGTSLVELHFGNYLETVGNNAFYGCKSLTEVTFRPGLKTIGAGAFQGCSALRTVTLPKGLEVMGESTIGNSAVGNVFSGCTSLEYLLIPSTVTCVGGATSFTGVSCPIFIENTENFVNANWESNWSGNYDKNGGTVYYLSEDEPPLNSDGTAYDGNFWHYDEDGNICVWRLD